MDVDVFEAVFALNAVFGVFFNLLLLMVAWLTPLPSNSKYKILVASFAAFNVLYSLLHVTLKPTVFIKGHLLYLVTFFLDSESFQKFFEIVVYMVIVVESHFILFVNFLYRYLMISRKVAENKNAFRLSDIVLLIVINLFLISLFVSFARNLEAKEWIDPIIHEEIQSVLHVELPRNGFFFAEISEKNLHDVLMLAGILSVFFINTVSMMVVGFKTYKLLNQHVLNLPIQKQIFHAILCQSIAPFFLGFLPSLIAIACTFSDINLGIYTNVLFVLHSLQPVVDPLFTLSLIKIYREKVFKTLFCRKDTSVKLNSLGSASVYVATADEDFWKVMVVDTFEAIFAFNAAVGVFLNFILLIVSWYTPLPSNSKYKILIVLFAVFNIFYSVLHVTLKPIIYVKGHKLAFITTFLTQEKWRFFEILAYMAIVIESHYLLLVNFLYRYFSLSRKVAETKNAFRRKDVLLLLLFNFIVTLAFLSFTKNLEAKEMKDSQVKEEIQATFHVEIPQYGFFYAEPSKSNLKDVCMVAGLLGVFFIITVSMMVVGFKTYRLLNQHILNLPIQKQIFHAILCQSIAPFFLGFLPSLIVIICTYSNVNLGIYTNILFVFHSLQPVVDPLFTALSLSTEMLVVMLEAIFSLSATLGVILNGLLLIIAKFTPLPGNSKYRNLVLLFAAFNVFYSLLHVTFKPVGKKAVFVALPPFEIPQKVFGNMGVIIYSSFLLESHYLIFVNLLYRCLVLSRKLAEAKNAFSPRDHGLLAIGNVIFVSLYSIFINQFNTKEDLDPDICEEIENAFHIDIRNQSFFYADASSKNWEETFLLTGMLSELLSINLAISVVGWRTYRLLNQLVLNAAFQKQFFYAILCQSLAPFFLTFLPCLSAFLIAFSGINPGIYSNIILPFFSLQPVVDPLFTLLMIKVYRDKLFQFLTNQPDTERRIKDVYEEHAPSQSTISLWSNKFSKGLFTWLKVSGRAGRPSWIWTCCASKLKPILM
ncbi:unnamed protein product [Caenorhabditis auriculariae]|uniref:G protein-coupled receptor n=1 Tax=Caenorhabditis auriculariae TaxID=2777116 RepID=A0A8S1HFQ3_9PELO|nr:unnamed protein product [Caenorhabditis auriculariae]